MACAMKTLRERAALTLVEVLVVIVVIIALAALLIPAVDGSRGTVRQAGCMNNLKRLGMAMIAYESANNRLPGYTQLFQRGDKDWIALRTIGGRIVVDSLPGAGDPPAIPAGAASISWAAMLLPYVERQDIWDRLVDPKAIPGHGELAIAPFELFACPADTDAIADLANPALSYSVNTGAWDLDATGPAAKFLFPPAKGDTNYNGLFSNLAAYQHAAAINPDVKPPTMRFAKIHDGPGETIMLSENCNKDYRPVGTNVNSPRFTWLGGGDQSNGNPAFGTEQQLGIVWVVNVNPAAGGTVTDQERINCDSTNPPSWSAQQTDFARPSSNHSGGVNVVFADGHAMFLSEDVDYSIYQQLITPTGKKCVDPRDWNDLSVIDKFRKTPLLTFFGSE
jgi:prepilin-type processing-associated H-X9-DG protein